MFMMQLLPNNTVLLTDVCIPLSQTQKRVYTNLRDEEVNLQHTRFSIYPGIISLLLHPLLSVVFTPSLSPSAGELQS